METWMRESSSTFLKILQNCGSSVPTDWVQLTIQQSWPFRGGSVPAHTWQTAQVQKGGSLSCFCVWFFLLWRKCCLFAGRAGSRGSCWCPEQVEAGPGFTGATWHCRAGSSSLSQHNTLFLWGRAELSHPVWPSGKKQNLKITFRAAPRLVFFTKLNLIFPPTQIYLEMAVSISLYNLLVEICSLLVLGQQFWALSVYFLSANKQNVIFWFSKSKGFWFHPTCEALQATGGSYLVLCELVAVPSWP